MVRWHPVRPAAQKDPECPVDRLVPENLLDP